MSQTKEVIVGLVCRAETLRTGCGATRTGEDAEKNFKRLDEDNASIDGASLAQAIEAAHHLDGTCQIGSISKKT